MLSSPVEKGEEKENAEENSSPPASVNSPPPTSPPNACLDFFEAHERAKKRRER